MPKRNASNATNTQTSVSLTASSLLYEPFPQPFFAAVGQIINPLFVHAQGLGHLDIAHVLQIQQREHAALIRRKPVKKRFERLGFLLPPVNRIRARLRQMMRFVK